MNEETRFIWGPFVVGMMLSIIVGAVADGIVSVLAFTTKNHAIGALIGLVPAVGLVLVSRNVKQNGFGQGMLVGACIVGLVGGFCGWSVGSGLQS